MRRETSLTLLECVCYVPYVCKNQKQSSRGFLWKRCCEICSKFIGAHPCRSMISIKLPCNFIEIRLWCGGSPVSLLHIFRIPFPPNASGQMLSKKQVWLKIHYYRMCIMTGLPQISNFNFFFKCSIVDVAVSFIFIKIRLNEENWGRLCFWPLSVTFYLHQILSLFSKACNKFSCAIHMTLHITVLWDTIKIAQRL